MKKLSIIFVLLFTLVIMTGCNKDDKTTRFNEDITKTTVTTLDEDGDHNVLSATSSTEGITTPTIKFAITTPTNSIFDTKLGYHVIKGTTPTNTYRVKINDYVLKRYYPSQIAWSYIASAGISTLKDGENIYVATALDKDGNEIASDEIVINYEAPSTDNLPLVGTNELVILLFSLMISLSYFGLRRIFQ